MLQLRSRVKICDRTGIVEGLCIKVLGGRKNLIGNLGDMLLISVSRINVRRLTFIKARLQKRFQKGTLHRVLVVRNKVNHQRQTFVFVRFNENATLAVNRRRIPVSNRLFGPIIREFTIRWPWFACISRNVV